MIIKGVIIRLADINGIEMTEALLYYLIVINVVTFLVYGIDKWRSTSKTITTPWPMLKPVPL